MRRHRVAPAVARLVRDRDQHASSASRWDHFEPDRTVDRQAARNFLMRLGDGHGFRLLIRDGAGQFTRSFDDVFAASGIVVIRIPPRAPQANAFAERWVRTLRHVLDRTIIWNERRLHALLVE